MCFSILVESDLKKLSQIYQAQINHTAYKYLKDQQEARPQLFKYKQEDRIYAKDWGPVITKVRGKTEIRPMRYQLLPHFCIEPRYTRLNKETGREVEISSTYNARIDSLTKARAWRKPFMRYHGIVPMRSFYEWVQIDGKATQIEFEDSNSDKLNVACIYDNWYSADKATVIQSFAILTTTPPPEVSNTGHDRCPVILRPQDLEIWLQPDTVSEAAIWELLNQKLENTLNSSLLKDIQH